MSQAELSLACAIAAFGALACLVAHFWIEARR